MAQLHQESKLTGRAIEIVVDRENERIIYSLATRLNQRCRLGYGGPVGVTGEVLRRRSKLTMQSTVFSTDLQSHGQTSHKCNCTGGESH